VQRTRRALRDALIALLPERGWDDLTVQDLCDRADVGRSTFYLQFRGKEDLLDGSLADLRAALAQQARAAGAGGAGALSFVRGLIAHVDEQRKLFRALIGRRSGHAVQARFRDMILQLVEEDLATAAGQGWPRDAAARYLAGALFELLAWWADARPAPAAEEVERLVGRLTRPALAQLKQA
jgi:AcrR family transcriptional regulator